jgi:RimJ/RimL family protein N-acetyltransferase
MQIGIEPVILQGRMVCLEPLRMEHASALYQALSAKPDLWRYMPGKQPSSVEEMAQFVQITLRQQQQGVYLPFVTIDLAAARIVGETRYLDIRPEDRNIEIGHTWLTPSAQRTGINTEAKYLMLCHAFEQLHTIRVQFKTHHLNVQSQQAIERLGAVKEGILRNCKIMPDGSYRHSVYYSIIESEWPQVKAALEAKLRPM